MFPSSITFRPVSTSATASSVMKRAGAEAGNTSQNSAQSPSRTSTSTAISMVSAGPDTAKADTRAGACGLRMRPWK